MSEERSVLKILTPIGEVPETDTSLSDSLEQLSVDAPLSVILHAITLWENIAVNKFKSHEKTEKSDKLDIDCW